MFRLCGWESQILLAHGRKLPKLVEDYERGVQYSVETHSFTSGGETFHTLATMPDDTLPSRKRTKVDLNTSTTG